MIEGLDWIDLFQGGKKWWTAVNTVMKLQVLE